MWFEFITFELYILGEASFGAASFLGSSWAPQPGYSKEASPTLSLILPEGIGQQEGKMEGRGRGQSQVSPRDSPALVWGGVRVCLLRVRGWGPELLRLLDFLGASDLWGLRSGGEHLKELEPGMCAWGHKGAGS